MTGRKIGVIGGSGLYAIDALEDPQWLTIDTPWGVPSDQLLTGRIGAVEFAFLPRHGRGHRLPPSDANARANIDALKPTRNFRPAPRACSIASGAATLSR